MTAYPPGKPRVTIFSTMTVDGKIASKTGYSKLSCPYDLERLHRLRSENDAVMVGANTVIRDDPLLTVRLVKGPQPVRIVVDARLRTPPTSKVYQGLPPTIIITDEKLENLARTKYEGVGVIGAPFESGLLDMRFVLKRLWDMGIRSILVEGGGFLNWSLIRQGLVDEVRVTISPYIYGGNKVCFVSGEGFDGERSRVKLKLRNVEKCRCGEEVHLVYDVVEYT